MKINCNCALHKTGHYTHWPCNENGYQPLERRKTYHKRVHKKKSCGCGVLIDLYSSRCRKCSAIQSASKRKGIPLPDWWCKKISEGQKGEKGNNWKGNRVDYSGLHRWIRKVNGKPEKCTRCEKRGEKIGRNWNIQWANVSRLYKRDVNDWIALCQKCHSSYEKENKEKESRAVYTGRDMHFKMNFDSTECPTIDENTL